MSITTVLFDLGSTLIYDRDPWPPIFAAADRSLAACLHAAGLPLDENSFCTEFGGFLDTYYADRGDGIIEKTTSTALSDFLLSQGFPGVPDGLIRRALDAMYTVTQQNWFLEEDALPTLEILRQRGFHIGLISNTADDTNVQQLIDRFALRPFFEVIITSAAVGLRKPDPRLFQLALDHFQVPPASALMVGDSLEADIIGANRLGLYSVWITRRAASIPEGDLSIQPQAVISVLSRLPALLEELNAG